MCPKGRKGKEMNKDELKLRIMQEFEKGNRKVNEIIPLKTFQFGLFAQLNPKEQELIEPSINELIEEGKVTYHNDRLKCLGLTQAGFDGLYKNSATKDDLEDQIMDFFRRSNCRVGDCVPFRNIRFNLINNLNPKEQFIIVDAIKSLIDKHYIKYVDSPLEALVLQQEGYDYIY